MKSKRFGDFLIIGAIVFILDWILGVLCAWGILPQWVFLAFNVPIGAVYVWMESSWMGTHYRMLGLSFTEFGSLVVFLVVVLGQSLVYFALFKWWKKIRRKKTAA